MPTVPTASKVLVTGANGFIALWVVRYLLEKGYSVRGTVRSQAKGQDIQTIFAEYGEKFEYIVVDNFSKEGAFDEAVKGVDAIEHTASPVSMTADDPQELIRPAIHGTIGILESARKWGPNVKRVVVTSSTAAVFGKSVPTTYSEADWNDYAVKDVEEQGRAAASPQKYRASKTLAERAAWDFVAKYKGTIGWDLVVLNPTMVFGPIVDNVPTPEALSYSPGEFYKSVVKCNLTDEELVAQGASFIDVRDLADAHVVALEKEEAGGERIIISSAPYKWQDWLDAANAVSPPIPGIRKGRPGSAKGTTQLNLFDTTKMKQILGLNVRELDETAKDVLLDYQVKGWLPVQ